MDISQIKNLDFTEDTEPRDEHLVDLLERAYRGEILCRLALVDIGVIKPYSNYRPETREHYKHNFMKRLRSGEPAPLHVYVSGNSLIMSDDYNTYWLYRELGEKKVLCIVIGDTPKIDGVQYLESSFQLPKPSFSIEDAPPSSFFSPDKTMTWEDVVKTILNTRRTKVAYSTEDSNRGRPHSFLIDYPNISNDSEAFLAKTTLHDIPKNVDNFDSLSQAQQIKLVRLFEDMALGCYIVSDQNLPDSKLEVWNAILGHHLNSAPAELKLGSLIERRDVKTALGEAYQSGWFEVSRSRYEAAQVMEDLKNDQS